MAIKDATFDDEKELEAWTFANIPTFFGQACFLPGFRITTPAGKHGVPDGFAFNFNQRAWWVIECELLAHGVWPHIAEQITRFVVAVRNPPMLRRIRDRLFEKILGEGNHQSVASALCTDVSRLLQQVELFVEGVTPSIAIFIDETDKDLMDFCDALEAGTEVYRVKKFVVNGTTEYYSPDKNLPVISFDTTDKGSDGSSTFDTIERLGGGEVVNSRTKVFRLNDGRLVKIQYSKFHERSNRFWYGVTPLAFQQAKAEGFSDFIFVLGDTGFIVLPLAVLERYLQTALVTRNNDGNVRHYHLQFSPPPSCVLAGFGNAPDIDCGERFEAFT